MADPFRDLEAALRDEHQPFNATVRIDGARRTRTGSPEIVLAAGKSDDQVHEAVAALLETEPRVIVSRCEPGVIDRLEDALRGVEIDITRYGTIAVISRGQVAAPTSGGRVAVISAGSSDVPVAVEAVVVAQEMGCELSTAWDVGVAGLHRLVAPLRRIIDWEADVIVIAAGMDGVLPTVVAGLVASPVIGLPVSTGYGHGGRGEAALNTMLQSCAPGVVVVNIDNGVGAGIAAARIANRAANARSGSQPPGASPTEG